MEKDWGVKYRACSWYWFVELWGISGIIGSSCFRRTRRRILFLPNLAFYGRLFQNTLLEWHFVLLYSCTSTAFVRFRALDTEISYPEWHGAVYAVHHSISHRYITVTTVPHRLANIHRRNIATCIATRYTATLLFICFTSLLLHFFTASLCRTEPTATMNSKTDSSSAVAEPHHFYINITLVRHHHVTSSPRHCFTTSLPYTNLHHLTPHCSHCVTSSLRFSSLQPWPW
jgi:hypothetical protein